MTPRRAVNKSAQPRRVWRYPAYGVSILLALFTAAPGGSAPARATSAQAEAVKAATVELGGLQTRAKAVKRLSRRMVSGGQDRRAPNKPPALSVTGATGTTIGLAWGASRDNVGVVGYGTYLDGTRLASTASRTFTFGSLSCGRTYRVGVDAFDAAGNRSNVSSLLAATDACQDNSAPTAPTGITQLSQTETSITLLWQASSDDIGVVGYRVFRDGTQIGTTSGTTFSVTGLACGTSYTLAVEAFDAAGNHSSRPAAVLSTAVCSDTSAPTTPPSLQLSSATATSISVAWGASVDDVGVTGYTLYLGSATIGTTTQTTYSLSGLTCGTGYGVGVDAFDAAGNRSPRATVQASTSACEPAPVPSPAESLYVTPTGFDVNPCTPAQPCRSFGRAYKAAAPGATVLVAAGTYAYQEISRDTAKTSRTPVIFQPSGGAVTVAGTFDFGQGQFDRPGPTGVTIRNMKVKYLRSWAGSSDITWENIDAAHFDVFDSVNVTIRGGDFGPCEAPRDDPACVSRIAGTSSNVVIDGASIHDVTSTDLENYHVDGMFIRGGSNIVIRNSKFWGNMITNIRVQDQACCTNTNLLIENNWFNVPLQGDGVTPRNDAINVDTPVVGNLTIQFNSFAENAYPQVVGPGILKGNLMQNAACAPGITYAYNVFIPFSVYTGQSACGPTDKKVSSFGYVSNAPGAGFDYRLAAVTPGVDWVPTSSGCPATDFEGTQRPQGGACDAGADER